MAGMDAQFMNENFTDGIQLNYVGERIVQGKEQVIESLCQVKYGKTVELHIHHLITHGSTGARKGSLYSMTGSAWHFVTCTGSAAVKSKIKEITSYTIPLSE